jgi:hypothetical protein
MNPGETIEAPDMGLRVTCRENPASSAGELLSVDSWMRGGATPRRYTYTHIGRSG